MTSSPCLAGLCFVLEEPLVEPRSGIAWIDVASLVVILLGIVLGMRRGLWWQLVRVLGIVAALCVARALAPRFSGGLTNLFEGLSPAAANGILWSGVLVLGLIVVALVGRIGRLLGEGAELSVLDRAGGGLLGAAGAALLLVGVLVCATQLASVGWSERVLRGTRTQGLIDRLARSLPAALDPIATERAAPAVWAASAPR